MKNFLIKKHEHKNKHLFCLCKLVQNQERSTSDDIKFELLNRVIAKHTYLKYNLLS